MISRIVFSACMLAISTQAMAQDSTATCTTKAPTLEQMRERIDQLDSQLMDILAERMAVCREVGRYKSERQMPIVQSSRFGNILKRRADEADAKQMSRTFIEQIFREIHSESVRQQEEIISSDK